MTAPNSHPHEHGDRNLGRGSGRAASADAVRGPGDEIAGCRITRVVGGGSSCTVYHAQHLTLEREVAIKVLSRELAQESESSYQRFQQEMRTAARLVHPNIVQIYDAAVQDGHHFLIMEYVDGQTLDSLLASGKPLALEVNLEILSQLCEGLAFVHSVGVVHRDINPSNVLVGRDRSVKLMDFGLAKSPGSAALTAIGRPLGSPHYISPEACSGDASVLSDIYSLGATFYHALAGRQMFPGETPVTVMVKHLSEQPVDLRQLRPDLPPRLTELTMNMVRKAGSERPQNMDAVLLEIRAVREEREAAKETKGKVAKAPVSSEGNGFPRGRLLCLNGAIKGRRFPLSPDGSTSIGRMSSNSIGILHQTVSRRKHCVIEAKEGGFTVTDNGSANGCKVNGKPILQSALNSGDTLQVGEVLFNFRVLAATEDACDLAEILVERGALSGDDAGEALDEFTDEWHQGSSESLGQMLVKKNAVSPVDLGGALELLDSRAREHAAQLASPAAPPEVGIAAGEGQWGSPRSLPQDKKVQPLEELESSATQKMRAVSTPGPITNLFRKNGGSDED